MSQTVEVTDLKKFIRDIPDFPEKGIVFKDITPLLKDPIVFKETIDLLAQRFKKENIDYVVGIEARGFIFGSALAYKLGAGIIPVRKKGKLPFKTNSVTYDLEYGTDTLEIHADAIPANSRVLIVDDVLATGGTVSAVTKLIRKQNAQIVGLAFLIELTFLKGREKLKEFSLFSLIQY